MHVVDDRDVSRFIIIPDVCGLQQLLYEPTHVYGHTLDIVIKRDTRSIVSDVKVTDLRLFDHPGRMSGDNFAQTSILFFRNN